MLPGDVDVSTPVFVTAPPTGAMPITAPSQALRRMLGATIFTPDMKRIGVYWESYGIAPGDTVDVTVRIEKERAAPTLLRRIALLIGLGSRGNPGVSVHWREPSAERTVTTLPGRIPVQGRSISVDLSLLTPGDYSLMVSVDRSGRTGGKAVGSRYFTIAPR
jgi:hypothetical protein